GWPPGQVNGSASAETSWNENVSDEYTPPSARGAAPIIGQSVTTTGEKRGLNRLRTDEVGISMPMALALIAMAVTIALLAAPAIRHWRETTPPPPAPVRASWVAPPGLDV